MATKDMSKGIPWKVLLLFALPMVLSISLQQIYNIADSAIAGNFISEDAFTSISASYPITMIFLGIASGCGIGGGVVVSRYFGMKNNEKVKTTISSSLITFIGAAIIIGILGVILTERMLIMLNTDQEVLSDSVTYLRIYCLGFIFLMLYNVVTYIFQALGNSKTPLYFLIFSTSLNIFLDLIFVLCFKMGIMGIAVATLITQGIASICSLLFLIKSLKKMETKEYEKYSLNIMKTVLAIAIPSIIQASIVAIGGLFVQREINRYGKTVMAGYGAAYKVSYIIVNIFFAVSNALSNFTSQNIGANQYDRVKKGYQAGVIMSLIFGVVTTILFLVFSKEILYIFLDKDASRETIKIGSRFIYIVCPFFCMIAFKISADGVLKGSGDMQNFMIGTFLDLILRVIFTFILSRKFGFAAIWWSWPIGWIFATIYTTIMYYFGRWKKINKALE